MLLFCQKLKNYKCIQNIHGCVVHRKSVELKCLKPPSYCYLNIPGYGRKEARTAWEIMSKFGKNCFNSFRDIP